jgi:hypothetical protein
MASIGTANEWLRPGAQKFRTFEKVVVEQKNWRKTLSTEKYSVQKFFGTLGNVRNT